MIDRRVIFCGGGMLCIGFIYLMSSVTKIDEYPQFSEEAERQRLVSLRQKMRKGKKYKMLTPATSNLMGENIKNNLLPHRKSKMKYRRKCNGEILHHETFCNNQTRTKTGQRLLVYSLFGHGTRWNSGGLEYAETIPIIANTLKQLDFFENWQMRIYHDGGPHATFIARNLSYLDNVQFCNTPCLWTVNLANVLGTFFRTAALADPNVDVFCSRDLDAVVTYRESMAIKEWYDGDKIIHLMRDNPMHFIILLGGMWCMKTYKARNRAKLIQNGIEKRAQRIRGVDDQGVLNDLIWIHFKFPKDTLQHDSFHCKRYPESRPYPVQRHDLEYIGCNKFPCIGTKGTFPDCPIACRPTNHQDWLKC